LLRQSRGPVGQLHRNAVAIDPLDGAAHRADELLRPHRLDEEIHRAESQRGDSEVDFGVGSKKDEAWHRSGPRQ
jgi:hypothetical protein